MTIPLVLFAVLLAGCSGPQSVRIATFNTALSRTAAGDLHAAFATGEDAKAKLVAEVLQRTRPDIVLLQEVDYDPTGHAYADFQHNYLNVSQNGAEPIHYDYVYAPPVNTGVLAEVDLDGDGKITRPNDCYGYGLFEGQYGMVVMSRYPIQEWGIVSLDKVLWKDFLAETLPGNYYSESALHHLRLSSKTHARVTVFVGLHRFELFVCHPTPPVFDGPEDRNGWRNLAEIALMAEMINYRPPESRAHLPEYLREDRFIVMGDLNADPNDGESRPGAIQALLHRKGVNQAVVPKSAGGIEAARLQAGANLIHKTDPATDTADFGDTGRGPGNLRVDYVLPSIDLDVAGSGVYWPVRDDPHAYLNKASDHKLVWIDVRID